MPRSAKNSDQAPHPRSAAERAPAQRAPKLNRTGLPDALKSGVEGLSGHSLDHVRVHRNSAKPAQLNAHAYAQGSDIHLAPGQEKHLPHEAWHVVQQAQGRVQPTTHLQRTAINDDPALEREADTMGARALSSPPAQPAACDAPPSLSLRAPLRDAPNPAIQRHLGPGNYVVKHEGSKPNMREDKDASGNYEVIKTLGPGTRLVVHDKLKEADSSFKTGFLGSPQPHTWCKEIVPHAPKTGWVRDNALEFKYELDHQVAKARRAAAAADPLGAMEATWVATEPARAEVDPRQIAMSEWAVGNPSAQFCCSGVAGCLPIRLEILCNVHVCCSGAVHLGSASTAGNVLITLAESLLRRAQELQASAAAAPSAAAPSAAAASADDDTERAPESAQGISMKMTLRPRKKHIRDLVSHETMIAALGEWAAANKIPLEKKMRPVSDGDELYTDVEL